MKKDLLYYITAFLTFFIIHAKQLNLTGKPHMPTKCQFCQCMVVPSLT